jgi:PII-like signaling protein
MAGTCPEDAATLKLYVVESDHKLGGLMVALAVAFAANGTGIVGVVVYLHVAG